MLENLKKRILKGDQLTPDKCKAIDEFVTTNGGLIFHETFYNKAVSKYWKTELEYILLESGNGEISAVLVCHKVSERFRATAHAGFSNAETPYGGWVVKKESNIENLYESTEKGLTLASLLWENPFSQVNYDGFVKVKENETGGINLLNEEEEIWTKVLNGNRRNMIRRAQKEGIIVRIIGMDEFHKFDELNTKLRVRFNLSVTPDGFHESLMEHYGPKNQAAVLLAEREGELLYGIFVLGNKNVMHYWHGAPAEDVKNLGQGELLQWEAIRFAREIGSSIYDLCVIEEERLPSIAKFKLGFTENRIPYGTYVAKTFGFKIIAKLSNYIPG